MTVGFFLDLFRKQSVNFVVIAEFVDLWPWDRIFKFHDDLRNKIKINFIVGILKKNQSPYVSKQILTKMQRSIISMMVRIF